MTAASERKRRGIEASALLAAGILLSVLAPAASADIVVEQKVEYTAKRGVETDAVEDQVYWLSEDRARLEQGKEIYLIDLEHGSFHYLDSSQKHFDERKAPFDLANTIPEEYLEVARRQFIAQMPSRVDMSAREDAGTRAGYEVKRVVLTAGAPSDKVQAEIEMWVSPELWRRLAGTAYWALEKDRLSASPVTAWMVGPLEELAAFPVEYRARISYHGRETAYVRTLVSVSERDAPQATYEVPPGYSPFPGPP